MPYRYRVLGMTHRQNPADGEIETITKADAAALIGVSLRTLERYVSAGRITPLPVPMKPRYFSAADVERLKTTGSAVEA